MPCWRKAKAVSFLVSVLLVGGCHKSESSKSFFAPDFELRDTTGKTVHLSQFRGHPVLLDFWATWCGPCLMSIPSTEKFYEANKGKGLVVLGLNMDDDPSDITAFVKHMGITYPVLYAGASTVPGRYALEGLPLFIVVDSEGRVISRYDGFSPAVMDAIDGTLTQLLAASKP